MKKTREETAVQTFDDPEMPEENKGENEEEIKSEPKNFSSISSLKYLVIPILGLLHSLPTVVMITVVIKSLNIACKVMLSRLLVVTLPWLFVSPASMWLLWYGLGHRLSGEKDLPMHLLQDENHTNDNQHVAIALLANMNNFYKGMLAVLMTLPHAWALAVLVGLLNFFVSVFTELAPMFRKYAEYKATHYEPIKPLVNQQMIAPFFSFGSWLGVLIRESYPIINAVLRVNAYVAMMRPYPFLFVLLPFIVPSSLVTLTHFEVAQVKEHFDVKDHSFLVENFFIQCPGRLGFPFRLLGYMLNGEWLFHGLRRGLSINNSAIFITVFSALGLMALFQQSFEHYITDLFVPYLLGDQASEWKPPLQYVGYSLAASGAALYSYAKLPCVTENIEKIESRQHHHKNIVPMG